ncbi:hypothetical protein MCOR25_009485 [Pyricularia grisea]|uniref:LysM domain-containing protein n=1 Tax=Pyricularia grisea TaxID=148305 RepID=A0A6P8BHP1_PYRGI|nr:uncharacterized protein PgNI_00569 [Pyricularia grisea]KAI6352215.1 hypothetical protein MCOR25_009485 [Pyricularia grisea]TLD16245.1 hypothetical protein PgNI_00569 [Pyricularia grisea]
MLPITIVALFAAFAAATPSSPLPIPKRGLHGGLVVRAETATGTNSTKGGKGSIRGCEDLKTNGPVISYKVVSGDTLTKLTAAYQSGICNIAKESNVTDPDSIAVDQMLRIPTGLCTQNVDNNTCLKSTATNPNTDAQGTCLKKGPFTYTVKKGDNFTTIAKSLGLQESAVSGANKGVDGLHLPVGSTVNLPKCSS